MAVDEKSSLCFQSGQRKHSKSWLGVDGGQSAIRTALIDERGTVMARGKGGPVGRVLTQSGQETLEHNLQEAVEGMKLPSDLEVEGAYLGLSGVTPGGEQEEVTRNLATKFLKARHLYIGTDLIAAQVGAFSGRPGIVIVAGSGSGVIGVGTNGASARAGGWGYMFGDEGGGFWIAKEVIRYILKGIDHGQHDPLIKDIETMLFPTKIRNVSKSYYAQELTQSDLAEMTPMIVEAAENDAHPLALAVLGNAAKALASQIDAVGKQLEWRHAPIEWSGVGGVVRGSSFLRTEIATELNRQSHLTYRYRSPNLSPSVGAALLAKKLTEANSDSILESISHSVT